MRDIVLAVVGSFAVLVALVSLIVLGGGVIYAILYSGYVVARWCVGV